MSFKEVKELRKLGKLEEAINLAKQDLEKEPSDIWNKLSFAWVYYDYLKRYSSVENFERFIEYLEKLKSLELPVEKKMIFDSCIYQVGKLVFALSRVKKIEFLKINTLYEKIKFFNLTKPSEAYSFLYKAFHKVYKRWPNYLEFADWWDFNNFRSQDYLPETFNDKRIMSIVEQAYIAYSKKLLEGEQIIIDECYLREKKINKNKIKAFLPKLELLIESHPEYQYPPYFKAKLLLALGDEKNVLAAFIPFAKKKKNNFWVWELMADTFTHDDEKKLSCLSKALSLKTQEDFLVNTRKKLADLLIAQNKYQEAKTEIEKIISARGKNNWSIPKQVIDWTKQSWYNKTKSNSNNTLLYKQHLKIAEEILFQDIPEEIVVVEFINKNKSIINFVKDKSKHGFFNYSGLIENPKIGDILSIRFNKESKDSRYKVLSIKKKLDETKCAAIKEFHGEIKIKESANFGFVENVFITPKLIDEMKIAHNQEIIGKAILSFNKKKEEWGWKAISIKK